MFFQCNGQVIVLISRSAPHFIRLYIRVSFQFKLLPAALPIKCLLKQPKLFPRALNYSSFRSVAASQWKNSSKLRSFVFDPIMSNFLPVCNSPLDLFGI